MNIIKFCIFLSLLSPILHGIELGVDRFFSEKYFHQYEDKKIALITNATGRNKEGASTIALFKEHFPLVALFAPEHGIDGRFYAAQAVPSLSGTVPVYSLHGKTRRPSNQMLEGIEVIFYDIQDVGVRPYTYTSTLYYVMEEAAKRGIAVVVLDRPNPLGALVEGEPLNLSFRSFIGYISIPYCHGMTVGELARYFNAEHKIGCQLTVIPMKGWKREMTFQETGLVWMPTSPNIPEIDTPFFFATTGLIGALRLVDVGTLSTLPFKVIGAPWIDAERYTKALTEQNFAGVTFFPFHYQPLHGLFAHKVCHGTLIRITDYKKYRPLQVQCLLLGTLKSLYPKEITAALEHLSEEDKCLFYKACGSQKILEIVSKERYPVWSLVQHSKKSLDAFLQKRRPFLIAEYN